MLDIFLIKALLEKATEDICEAQMNREKFDSLSLARQKIDHVLRILKKEE